jgi:anti-sigma factor RsiW
MTAVRPSLVCQRVREQVSLQLDDELSQLERRMLDAHLARCPDCHEFADEVVAFTEELRTAPLEVLERPVVVTRPRRLAAVRLQAGVAAALAFAALGLGAQIATSGPNSELSFASSPVTRYPTQAELQREAAILKHLPLRGSRAVLPR